LSRLAGHRLGGLARRKIVPAGREKGTRAQKEKRSGNEPLIAQRRQVTA